MIRNTIVAVLVTAAYAGCGGGTTQTPEPAAPQAAAEEPIPEVTAPPKPWEEMSMEARKGWMMEKVLPVMAAKFQQFDADEYEDFDCASCHGDDAKERHFEMPSPDLPALYPSGHPKQEQMVEEHEASVKFMFNEVVPTTQQLLGAEPFDEETGEGFSCFSCHPKADVEGGVEGGAEEMTGEGEAAEAGEAAETGEAVETGEGAEAEGAEAP